jgi:Flp pilus assembly protein TadG
MRRLMPNRRRDESSDKARSRGQSLVEFALVLPILLMIFAAAADFGRAFYAYVAIENAVKEGAIYGARNPLCDTASTSCINPNNVTWRVRNETRVINQDGTVLNPTIQCQDGATGVAHADLRDCVEGDRYVVRLSYQFNMITPIIGAIMGNQITLGAQSTATVLNRAFDPTPGVSPTKLVSTTNASNAADIIANCNEPDPTGSPGFYRQPCKDVANLDHELRFPALATITYKLIGTNIGGSTISGVTMADSDGWPGSCPAVPSTMTVNQTWECTYSIAAPTPYSGMEAEHVDTYTIDSAETVAFSDTAKVITYVNPPDLRVLKYANVYKLGGDGDGTPVGFGTNQALSLYRSLTVPSVTVWYKIIVRNQGDQTATGLAITDTNGPLPTNSDCPARPSSLAAGASYECIYSKTFLLAGTTPNTARATATNVTPDANDDSVATVTIAACTGTNAVVPNVIGLDKGTAKTVWQTAGFSPSNLTSWGGSGGITQAQSQQAYTCLPTNSSMTIYKDPTP